jgi:Ala-tRNA(Pro) deacylase
MKLTPVAQRLQERGVAFELVPHEKTFTSIEEARALGIAADEVVKTVVLDTRSGHALAVVPASRRLDMRLVRDAVHDSQARLASEDELERDFSAYELGALPPLGSLVEAPTYVDPEVMAHDTVVFAAGTQTESVKLKTEDLFRDEAITIAPLTRSLQEADESPTEPT